MKVRNLENALALVGALVVIIGVSSAADKALAEEIDDVTTTAVAIHNAGDDARHDARRANADAAAEAIEALELANWVDLDYRLADHTSMMAASRK